MTWSRLEDSYAGQIAYVMHAKETGQSLHLAPVPTTRHASDDRAGDARELLALARIDAIRGCARACRARVARGLALAQPGQDTEVTGCAVSILGLLELSLGHPDAAAEYLGRYAQFAGTAKLEQAAQLAPESDYVEALVALGRRHDARQAATRQRQHAMRLGQPAAIAVAARSRGLLAGPGEFEHEFERALGLHDLAQDAFDWARTQLCYGERLRRLRQPARAREHLAAARATFERLRATPWAQRADRELQASSITHHPRQDPAARDRLTPQEHRVATIIAAGASIRQAAAQLYLSPKTIEAHLGRAYRKLGVHNRAQLATRIVNEQAADI